MNPQVERLYTLSKKDNRLIIGLMSGTSLDGLDIALCHIQHSGTETQLELLHFVTKVYTEDFRSGMREVFAKRQIDQQKLSGLHAFIGRVHGQLIAEALEGWNISNTEIDLIASHGQTVYHAPRRLTGDLMMPDSTLQIGDADHIAMRTGIITVS
ncbi:MAG TPA: anhydro-N-acetylmuramic acid kinase, partial [Sphingobacterium sp.]|nr:anhydro-N-acetylmuramic acid kinase [Sphingobacterium sp.]